MSSVSHHKKRIEECLKKNIQINAREAKIEADYILKFALKKPSSFFRQYLYERYLYERELDPPG